METSLSRNIRKLRQSNGLSKEDFGKELGITPNEVYDLEIGEKRASRELLDILILKFDTSLDELLKNDNVDIPTAGRKILDIIEVRNEVIENVYNMAEYAEDIETPIYDELTDKAEYSVYTADMQAKDQILKSINFENRTLDELVNIYQFLCDKEISELSKDI